MLNFLVDRAENGKTAIVMRKGRIKNQRFKKVSLRKLKEDSRAISPIVATLLLVLMSVSAGSAFFIFISGWQDTIRSDIRDGMVSPSQITMTGSTSMADLMSIIGPEFEKSNPGIKVGYSGSGSEAGLFAIENHLVDLAMISMEADQVTPGTTLTYPNLVQTVVGYQGIGIFAADSTLSAHGILVKPGKSIDMNQTLMDAICQTNLPASGTSAASLGVSSTVINPPTNQIDVLTFGPAATAGTVVLTLDAGATVTVNIPIGGLSDQDVAAAFAAAAMPGGWSASLTAPSTVTFTGPAKICGPVSILDSKTGSVVTEKDFINGTEITSVKDTLTFFNATAPGTIIVTLPDGITKISLVIAAGQSANDTATAFRAALPSGWTAPAPVNGVINISGPMQNGFVRATASNGSSGALPIESGFVDGNSGRPVNDTLAFHSATSPGTVIVTLPDGITKIPFAVTTGQSANAIAAAFRAALPGGWTAPVPVNGVINISGPTQSGFNKSSASNGASGALPTESGFIDGNPGSRVKDTLSFGPSSKVGSIIVTLPDGITQMTVVVGAGQSAIDIATSFRAALPGGWTAPVPTDGNVTISGPYQSDCQPSMATEGVTGALPTESNFINGQVGSQAITDTLTFSPATQTGVIIVTLPDGITQVTVTISSVPRTAVQVASAFQSALPSGWRLISQVGGTITFSGPYQSGQPSTAIDLVSGSLPTESGFKDGSNGATPVKDTLTFSNANAVGTFIVTLPDGSDVTVVTNIGQSANAVASAFKIALPVGWSGTTPVGGAITISGPSQSGYVPSTVAYVVSGAAPTESGFVDGSSVTPVTDTLTFSQASAAGTFVVVLPDNTQVTLVTTNGETADAVATSFISALPSGWSASGPVAGAVTIFGPLHNGFDKSYAYDIISIAGPVESGFKDGSSAATPVSDKLTFFNAIADGTIVVTLPDQTTKITLNLMAGESAFAIASSFQTALPGGWSGTTPVGGAITISGPSQSGYVPSEAVDVVSGSLPTESSFIDGRPGAQGVTDTLTFGPANSVGTFTVTLPDGVTTVPIVITSAPRTAVQVASAFQNALPSGWDLISQIANVVTFSGATTSGQPSTAVNGITGAMPIESGFVDGAPITSVMDNLTFSPSSAAGTVIVTLPDGISNVTVITSVGQSADAVAATFRTALPVGWSATVPSNGKVTISGPSQSGYGNCTVIDGVSGALPTQSGFIDGVPINFANDTLTFGDAESTGNITVTLPDGTPVTVACTLGETANSVASAFIAALPGNWTAPAPVGGMLAITGPSQSGFSKTTSLDVPSGAWPTESGFVDGNPGAQIWDTLTFGPASAPGTITVTLPDGQKVLVIIDGPKTATQVASAFQYALPSGWNVSSQIGNVVTFWAPGLSGIPSIATEVGSGITNLPPAITPGFPGSYLQGSLPSWGGLQSGFIRTWGDLESVLMAQGSVEPVVDPVANNLLNAYFRVDSGSEPESEQSLIGSCMSDPDGIGFLSMGLVLSMTGAEVFTWNGVTPSNQHLIDSVENYGTSQYSLWHPMIFVSSGRPNGDVETFVNWIKDPNINLALAQTAGFTSLYEAG